MIALLRRSVSSDFARSGALVFGASLLANFFNYVFYVVMGRILDVREYGVVMSLISIVLVVLGIGQIAQTAVAKLAADLRAADDAQAMAAFSRGVMRTGFWLALAVTVLTFGTRSFVARYLHMGDLALVTVAGVTAGLGFALVLQRGLLQGFGNFKTFALSNVLDTSRTALLVPLVHAFGAIGSLLSFFGAVAAACCYGEFALRRQFGRTSRSTALDVRRMSMIAGATGLSSVGIMILMFYDVVLARHFLNPVEAGLYGAAALAGRVIFAIVAFLPTILLPNVATRAAQGRSSKHVLAAALAIAAVVIGSIATACAFAPQVAIRLLAGPNFIAGAPLIFPYVLASGALALASLFSTFAIARHRFGFVPYLLLVAFGEVIAVVARHASTFEIIQDVVAGHAAVLSVMAIFIAFDFARSQQLARLEGRG